MSNPETDKPEKNTDTAGQRDAPGPHADQSENAQSDKPAYSMKGVLMALVGLVIGAATVLWSMGPSVTPSDTVELDNAYIHGAVAQVGIARDARIVNLHVELGDKVSANDTIATLKSDRLQADVATAQARVSRLSRTLEAAQIKGALDTEASEASVDAATAAVRSADARVKNAAAQMALAETELTRTRTLAEKGIVAQRRLDEIVKAAQSARANMGRRTAERAEARSALVEEQTQVGRARAREADRNVIRARIDEATAELDRRQTLLNDTDVIAGASGIVVDVHARDGASVRPGDRIVSVWDTTKIWMQAWAPEDSAVGIAVGDRAEIRIDALPGQVFEGTVQRILVADDGKEQTLPGKPISPLLPDAGRFAVQVAFAPSQETLSRLLPGMSGAVTIQLDPSSAPQSTSPTEQLYSWFERNWPWEITESDRKS